MEEEEEEEEEEKGKEKIGDILISHRAFEQTRNGGKHHQPYVVLDLSKLLFGQHVHIDVISRFRTFA